MTLGYLKHKFDNNVSKHILKIKEEKNVNDKHIKSNYVVLQRATPFSKEFFCSAGKIENPSLLSFMTLREEKNSLNIFSNPCDPFAVKGNI